MFRPLNPRSALSAASLILPAAFFAFGACTPAARAEYSETLLHTFGSSGNTDGDGPESGLAQTPDGTIWGTTARGGTAGDGTIFKYTVDGKYSVVHSFSDGSVANDGYLPQSALTVGPDGNLYGVTVYGGSLGYGCVFKMTPAGAVTILHSFVSGSDGSDPESSVTFGHDGKLYGTTTFIEDDGGDDAVSTEDSPSGTNTGTIYSLNPDGSDYVVQYRFDQSTAETIGQLAFGTLTPALGSSPVFYGTLYDGGEYGQGTLYAFTPGKTDGSGKVRIIHAFNNPNVSNDGDYTGQGRVNVDSSGNIIGETTLGGSEKEGAIYMVAPDGSSYRILHNFNGTDGLLPTGGLVLGSDGAYYGTAAGGNHNRGLVFRMLPTATGSDFSVVYSFGDSKASDGDDPQAKPFADSDGNLIGTTVFTGEPGKENNGLGELYKLITGLPNPVAVKFLTLSPATVTGGEGNSTATVTLNKPAGSNGVKLLLYADLYNRDSGSDNAASVPSSLTFPPGHETETFTVTTNEVIGKTIEDITAGNYNDSQSHNFLTINTVNGSEGLKFIVLSPASIKGGTSTTENRVYLYGDATLATPVTFTSSDKSVVTVQSSTTVQPGYSSHLFTFTTKPVAATKTVTITATSNGVTQTATLTVTP